MQVGTESQRLRVRLRQRLLAIFAWIGRMLVQGRRMLCALWQTIAPPALGRPALRFTRTLPDGIVTSQEAERLLALRERFHGRPECVEFEINEPRLRFAIWLVEHGQLAEFPEASETP